MTAFGFDGANAVATRPAHKPASEDLPWARDESAPGANDGTALTASLINMVVGNLRDACEANNVTLVDGSNTLLRLAMAASATARAQALIDELTIVDVSGLQTALDTKVAQSATLANFSDGDGFVRLTDSDKTKLDQLEANFKGAYASLSALSTAYPSAANGNWAIITHGAGVAPTFAAWDADEATPVWVDTGASAPTSIDWSNITNKPTSFAPAAHGHDANEINSGLLAYERGGLQQDISDFNGLLKVSGGVTSEVSESSLGGAWEFISSVDAASASSIDITELDSSYFAYQLVIHDFVGATSGVYATVQFSSDNGVSWLAGASYGRILHTTVYYNGSLTNYTTATRVLTAGISLNAQGYETPGAAATQNQDWILTLINPSNASAFTRMKIDGCFEISDGYQTIHDGWGFYEQDVAVNAIRIIQDSGNIAQGTFKLYGLKGA